MLPLLFSAAATAQQWKTFSADSILFTAKYPETWVNKVKEGKRVFFTSPLDNANDNFKDNINVSVVSNDAFATLKINDVLDDVRAELKKVIQEYTEESSRSFTWNGVDATELVYTGFYTIDLTTKARIKQWFCFYKKRLYTVTFTAAAGNTAHDTTAQKIMDSIKFKD